MRLPITTCTPGVDPTRQILKIFLHQIVHFQGNKFYTSKEANEMFPDFVYKPTDNPHHILIILEYICMCWFTFEYLIRLNNLLHICILYFFRLVVFPKRIEFMKKTLNVIDLLTILPFYLELCLPLFGMETNLNKLTGYFWQCIYFRTNVCFRRHSCRASFTRLADGAGLQIGAVQHKFAGEIPKICQIML